MAITIDGTDGISPLKASGQIQTTTGTAASPAISSSSDTDSGIFFDTNQVNISTGGTQRATVDSSGRLLVGTSTSVGDLALQIQGGGSGVADGRMAIRTSTTAPASGASIGRIFFYDGAGNNAATIQCASDGTWGSGDYPGRIAFLTTADGASSPTESMRIHSGGQLRVFNQPIASVTSTIGVDLNNVILTSANFYNTTWVNQGNHFNASTGRFTCPVDGIYRIYFRCSAANMNTNVRLRKNGATINEAYDDYSGDEQSVSSEAVVSCVANDYLEIQVLRLKTIAGSQHKQVTFQLLY